MQHLTGTRLKLEPQDVFVIFSPIIFVPLRRLFGIFKASVFMSVKWESDIIYFRVILGNEGILSLVYNLKILS